jgi:hypothetical protein
MNWTDSSEKTCYKYTKNSSISLTIKEMQTKTTLRLYSSQKGYHQDNNPQQLARVGDKGILMHCWWECKLCSHYGNQCGRSSKN